MTSNNNVIVTSTPECGNCAKLKKILHDLGVDFLEIDVSTPGGLAESRSEHGIYDVSVPSMKIGDVVIHAESLTDEKTISNFLKNAGLSGMKR